MPQGNNSIVHNEGLTPQAAVNERELELGKVWASIKESYDQREGFWSENTEWLKNFPNIEEVIEFKSKQIAETLESERDLNSVLDDIGLLTRMAVENNIVIGYGSPFYRAVLSMSTIPNSELENMTYVDTFALAEILNAASNLLPESEDSSEVNILRGKLIDLAGTAYYHLYSDDDDDADYSKGFNERSCQVNFGEEHKYNHKYSGFPGEPEVLTKYNLFETQDGSTFFKSCGLFIEVGNAEFAEIDFTPFNAVNPGEVAPRTALAMAYRGMRNFLHALENQEIKNNNLSGLYGVTNPTMALFASRFGFRIRIGDVYLDKDQISSQNADLGQQSGYEVFGTLDDIRRELEKFEESGLGKRLVKSYSRDRSQ